MEIKLSKSVVRSWKTDDANELARIANDRRIWLNLRDAFPHPYALPHAHAFISMAIADKPETKFAIAVGGQLVGSIAFILHGDVERVAAEIGYFLGVEYWGRGITTEALAAVTAFAFEQHPLERVYAVPFAHNTASCRVLEKAGFTREALMRRAVIKDGQVLDQYMYAITRS